MATGLTGAAVHAGNWFGLPDLGITETVQKILQPGAPLNSQGGSNLNLNNAGSYTPAQAAMGSTYNSPVAGTKTVVPVNYQSNPAPSGGSGSGGSGSGGNTTLSAEDQARNAYMSYLDNQYNSLPGIQDRQNQQINNLYDSGTSNINSQLEQTLNSLGTSKTNITDNKTSSLRDLSNQIMNQLKAWNTYLGVRGASDSTAGNQLAYALGKIGTQQRSGIEKQANQLYAQVDTQMNNAKLTAQGQLNDLNTWKNNQLLAVTDYINQLRGQIDTAKQQYIQSWLGNIDNQVNNYKNTIASWIVNKSNSLNQVVSQLQQYGIAPNTAIQNGTISSPMWGQIGQNSGTQLYGTVGSPKYDQYGNRVQ